VKIEDEIKRKKDRNKAGWTFKNGETSSITSVQQRRFENEWERYKVIGCNSFNLNHCHMPCTHW
jgi:hypothetical protein